MGINERQEALAEARSLLAAHDRREREHRDALLAGRLDGADLDEAIAFVETAAHRRRELELHERLRRLALDAALDRQAINGESVRGVEAGNQGARPAGLAGEPAPRL
jgi:hypothetical protein